MITVYLDDKVVDEAFKAGVRMNLLRFAARSWGAKLSALDGLCSANMAVFDGSKGVKQSMIARMVEELTLPGEGRKALGADQLEFVEAAVRRACDGLVSELNAKADEIAAAELRALKEKPRTL